MDLSATLSALLDGLDERIIPGCCCEVRHNGETIFRHVHGTSDYAHTRPVTANDLYFVYSCTKVITCTAVMQMVERGELLLYAPVSDYLPAFAQMQIADASGTRPAERPIRIYDLLRMCSGMTYDVSCKGAEAIRLNPSIDTQHGVALLAREPLLFEPDTDFHYSFSHDVLAAAAEAASGMRFDALLNERIFAPLGMRHTGFALHEDATYRLAAQYRMNPAQSRAVPIGLENEYRLNASYLSGGAGLISCLDDMIRFADALCNGERLLRADTRDLMRRDHLSAVERASLLRDWRFLADYSYGLGVRTYVENADGIAGTVGEFGWEGAEGSYLLIDPDNRVSCFYAQHVRNCEWACEHVHRPLRAAIYAFLSE